MLSSNLQKQIIADLLNGQANGKHSPDDFDVPWGTLYQAISEVEPQDRRQALERALRGREDGDSILGAILSVRAGEQASYQSLHELGPTLKPITWLWEDWIPRGMITLLGAVPGAGKSYLALDLTRQILEGGAFPDGTPVTTGQESVIYVDAELVPQLINERAKSWHMDTQRLFLMCPKIGQMIDFSQIEWRDRLIEMAYGLKPALIVVDSLSSISSKGENNVEDVREVLGFLNALAVDYECGLLLIHHLRKRGALALTDELSIDDFRGSSHIIAMSRSVLGLSVIQTGPEPDRNGPRRLEVIKTNLARYPEPVGVEFLPLDPSGVLLHYGDDPQMYQEPTKSEQCIEWLLEFLEEANEPVKPKEIVEQAEAAGFSRTLVYSARRALQAKISDTAGRRDPTNRWVLGEWDGEDDGAD
jgi:hypothetical protein